MTSQSSSEKVSQSNSQINSKPTLKQGLNSRQLSMIAIGGSIGTGLFIGSGSTIATAGPAGAIIAFMAIGIMVYFLVMSLGEMSAYMPVSGAFNEYAARFVDPSLGFAMGLNYWFNWAITIAAELSAATLITKFWFPGSSSMMWSAIFLSIMFFINALSVRAYGEAEFWFAFVKVSTIILFVIVGCLSVFGYLGGESIGFHNWQIGDAPFHGGMLAILNVFMIAGYSYQGSELIGVAAGESENPRKNIPRAVKKIFWRILIFNILTIFIIGLMIPYTDSNLLNDNVANVSMSPFTIAFSHLGLPFVGSIINVVILTAVLSAGNSGMYAATRSLWDLAQKGQAPKVFANVNRRGVPMNALLITGAVGMFAFLSSFFGDGAVYLWLLNASALSGFIAWLGIAISHWRFRRAFIAQGNSLSDLPFKAKFFPFGPLFAFGLCLFIIFGQNYTAFLGNQINWYSLIVTYVGLFMFMAVWLGYKFKNKTKYVKLHQCNLEL